MWQGSGAEASAFGLDREALTPSLGIATMRQAGRDMSGTAFSWGHSLDQTAEELYRNTESGEGGFYPRREAHYPGLETDSLFVHE